MLKKALGILGGSVLVTVSFAGIGSVIYKSKTPTSFLGELYEVFSGAIFSFGLVVSGMADQRKVLGFLSLGKPFFDPSLMFVMGSALCIIWPVYHHLLTKTLNPTCSSEYGASFGPRAKGNKEIDTQLIVGALLFGIGWGLYGVCPGPGFVTLAAAPTSNLVAFFASMLASQGVSTAALNEVEKRKHFD